MKTVRTFEAVREAASGRVGLVPTMGFLHEGHMSLIRAAAVENDQVVVSVFVNPTQFGDESDFASYPAELERDVDVARRSGADIVFAPSVEYIYGTDTDTYVDVGDVASELEGRWRPGHFAGVATLVAKLFAGVQPESAYFGRKDAQQLAVVRTMASALSFPVEIRGLPIVRESDGLALSSRNVRIDQRHRTAALSLYEGLMEGADMFERGDRSVDTVRRSVVDRIARQRDVDVEYVELAGTGDAQITKEFVDTQFLSLAAVVGGVRLIDNVTFDTGEGTVDRGTKLKTTSILYGGG